MTFPVNLKFGSFEVPSHLVFEIAAYTIGFRYYLALRKASNDLISTAQRIWILIGAAAGALVFSRLIGVLENPVFPESTTGLLVYLMSAKTIVGGLAGGLIGVEITKKFLGVTTSSGDLMAYPIILSMMIGRVGCFLTGLEDGTYGLPSSLPWAIDFGDGMPRHPTNLYEIVFLGILWLGMKALERNYEYTDGSRFKLFLLSYFLFRFCIEFIKPDYRFSFGLGTIQLVCLAGIVYYYKVFLFPRKLVNKRHPERSRGAIDA